MHMSAEQYTLMVMYRNNKYHFKNTNYSTIYIDSLFFCNIYCVCAKKETEKIEYFFFFNCNIYQYISKFHI